MNPKKSISNKVKPALIIPWKIRIYSALFLSAVISINLLFYGAPAGQLIYNSISSILIIMLLWYTTLVAHRWIEARFPLSKSFYTHISISLFAAILCGVGVVLAVDGTINFIQYLVLGTLTPMGNMFPGFFSAFLIAVSMLTIIKLVQLMRNTRENLVSMNEGIIESIAEGILVTDLNDNILVYNSAFKKMWQLDDEALKEMKNSVALGHAMKNVENAEEIVEIITNADEKLNERVSLTARMKNKRVLEGISMPQVVDGEVIGRIWSNRDITERINAEREEIAKGVAQAQFESLKNQVNPHFLFNSLNVLSSLVHIDANLSEKFIDQLARSYRYLLEQKDKELVSLKTEIEFVHSFSFLLKIRFEEKLKIIINLPAESMNDLIAPLTLQLLIENAVKHNTISPEEPLVIDIYMDSGDYLVVKNNIQIRVQRMPSTGVGLKNILDRYKLLTSRVPEFRVSNDTYIARIPLIKNT